MLLGGFDGIARRGKAESAPAMSPKYCFRPCIIHYFLVDCNKNTRKNFHSVVKVTFDR
jgi:hypothetical protein